MKKNQWQRERIIRLIEKMESGHASSSELAELDDFYEAFESKPDLTQGMSPEEKSRLKNRLYTKIYNRAQPRRIRTRTPHSLNYWVRIGAAAAILIVTGLAVYMYTPINRSNPPSAQIEGPETAIVPGHHRAALILADGRRIELDSSQRGIVMREGMITYDNGSWISDNQSAGTGGSTALQTLQESYLQLTVPRGGTYQITLPDGSKVWLNAGSTLHYPSRFSAHSRTVRLSGEAYFEIAQLTSGDGERVPFFVESGQQTTEVLGTAFNISAYSDEPEIRTTLVHGAVQILFAAKDQPARRIVLRPNEQSTLTEYGIDVRQVDVSHALAWKNGYFTFDNEHLPDIMKRISRWYDVDIQYDDDISQVSLIGIIPRSEDIETVLSRLEKTGEVKFKIEERRIHVMK